jgi:hypothetical protein
MTVVGRLALLLLSIGAVGCGSLEDKRPAKWSFIYATIIHPQCATVNCHSAIAKKMGFDLSERDVAYCSNFQNFVPTVLRGDDPKLGPRMPPDMPLPAPDIELIEAWQAAGGVNDAFASGKQCPIKSADAGAGD